MAFLSRIAKSAGVECHQKKGRRLASSARVHKRYRWYVLGQPQADPYRRLGYLQPSFFVSFCISIIYRFLYKIVSSISHFSLTTFSKSRSLYIKLYIRNVFYSKFLYVRIYHTSNAMDIFYFYLIQCLKRKEKIEKRRENLYI
jgi:hypothetical protein